MSGNRFTTISFALSAAVAVVCAVPLVGQSSASKQAATVKTPGPHPAAGVPIGVDGPPDLTGEWTYASLTPLERPAGMKAKLTPQEVAAYEKKAYAETQTWDSRKGLNKG